MDEGESGAERKAAEFPPAWHFSAFRLFSPPIRSGNGSRLSRKAEFKDTESYRRENVVKRLSVEIGCVHSVSMLCGLPVF